MKSTVLFLGLFPFLCLPSMPGGRRAAGPVEFRALSPRLFEVVGGRGARGGVYVGDDAVLVIDAKMDRESVAAVLAGIRERTDKPIRYLINTHSDGDHVRGNRYFPEGVTIVAHENCRREFFHPDRNGRPAEWNRPELAPFIPALTFRERLALHLGQSRVELFYFGVGHTTGDIVVYFPEEKTAFMGDQIFLERVQLIHDYKGGDSFAHVATLGRMLAELPATRFCSGHSEPTDRKGVEAHIRSMRARQEKVRGMLAAGRKPEQMVAAFPEAERRLVDCICREVAGKGK